MTTAVATASDRRALLRNRNFMFLMAGRTTSNAGRSARVFARAWLTLETTNSPFLLGVVTSSLSWPMLFMPFVGGVLADRIDRRKLLLFTEFSLAVLWTAVSIDIMLGWIHWSHLVVSGILSGVIQSLGRPGHDAMVGTVVPKEQIPAAGAFDNAAEHWPRDIGLLVATLSIPFVGTGGIFWATAILQTITFITLLMFKWDAKEMQEVQAKNRETSARGNFIDGLKHVKGEPVVLGLVLIAASASLFAGGHGFMLPIFARDILGGGQQTLGTMMIVQTLGTSLGAALVLMFINRGGRGKFLLAAIALYVAFLIGFAQSRILFLSLGLLFCMGLSSTVTRTVMMTILQIMSPNHLRGRIMSLRVTVGGLGWIGTLILGGMAEVIGVPNTVIVSGIVYMVVAILLYLQFRPLWRLN